MIFETDPAEPGVSRRELLYGAAMLAASAAAYAAKPVAGPPIVGVGGLEKAIPDRIGHWRRATSSGLVLPPRDETEIRTYDQVLGRVYTSAAGPPVMLLIAFGAGQTGLFEIHRPEACYPAQGYTMSDREAVQVAIAGRAPVPAIFWTANSDVRIEQLLYWTRVGHYFPQNWAETQLAVVSSNLVRQLPDGILVRMSTISPDRAESLTELAHFARALVHSLGPPGRHLLLGND